MAVSGPYERRHVGDLRVAANTRAAADKICAKLQVGPRGHKKVAKQIGPCILPGELGMS